jgi:hypothetical protein
MFFFYRRKTSGNVMAIFKKNKNNNLYMKENDEIEFSYGEGIPPSINFSPYKGEWVVISQGKIIAHHKDLTKIDDKIYGCKRTPTLYFVPNHKIHPLLG